MMIYHGLTLSIVQSPTGQGNILLGNNNQQQPATTSNNHKARYGHVQDRNVSNLNHPTPFAPLKPTKKNQLLNN